MYRVNGDALQGAEPLAAFAHVVKQRRPDELGRGVGVFTQQSSSHRNGVAAVTRVHAQVQLEFGGGQVSFCKIIVRLGKLWEKRQEGPRSDVFEPHDTRHKLQSSAFRKRFTSFLEVRRLQSIKAYGVCQGVQPVATPCYKQQIERL